MTRNPRVVLARGRVVGGLRCDVAKKAKDPGLDVVGSFS